MTNESTVAVTYVGKDDPYKDRMYRTGLTFTPGQTRALPSALAARFLRHSDVFQEEDAAKSEIAQAPAAAVIAPATTSQEPNKDDTAALLEKQDQQQSDERAKEDAHYALLEQLEKMDRQGLINWAQDTYKQKIPGNLGVAKARDMAKGFVDQYGMP